MIVFFEIDKVNVERYYFNRLEKNFDSENIVVVLEDPTELKLFKKEYPKIKSYLFLKWIIKESKNYKNSFVFINGNRIPDLLMSKLSHENNCKVIFLQHGMYIDFMKREFILYFKYMAKTFRYLFYALLTGNFFSLFKIHVFGYSRSLTSDCKNLYPDSAFVYSEYWKKWHINKYFHGNTNNFYFLKNNDLDQNIYKLDNTAVYCYQTLIEDGRINEGYYKNITSQIINSIKDLGMNFVVKGHPRMSESTKKFFQEKEVELVLNDFPSGGIIIGHYSTLLARWVYEKDLLFLVELKGHKIPESIENLAHTICTAKQLDKEIRKLDESKKETLKKRSDFYFNYSSENSVNTINEIIASIA